MPPNEAPQGTQAIIRAIRLLKAFTPQKPERTLNDLCRQTGLTKTTTHRLLSALESEELLVRHPVNGAYQLGPAVIALGSQALLSNDLREVVRPTLEALAAQTGETTTLEVLVGDQMLILDGVSGRHLISAALEIGTRWPIHATSTGKCMLAFMDASMRTNYLQNPLTQFTPHSITDTQILRYELQAIMDRGYSVAVEELEQDYAAVSTIFRGPLGKPEGALSIGGPASRFTPERIESMGKQLLAAADGLSQSRAGSVSVHSGA